MEGASLARVHVCCFIGILWDMWVNTSLQGVYKAQVGSYRGHPGSDRACCIGCAQSFVALDTGMPQLGRHTAIVACGTLQVFVA